MSQTDSGLGPYSPVVQKSRDCISGKSESVFIGDMKDIPGGITGGEPADFPSPAMTTPLGKVDGI